MTGKFEHGRTWRQLTRKNNLIVFLLITVKPCNKWPYKMLRQIVHHLAKTRVIIINRLLCERSYFARGCQCTEASTVVLYMYYWPQSSFEIPWKSAAHFIDHWFHFAVYKMLIMWSKSAMSCNVELKMNKFNSQLPQMHSENTFPEKNPVHP